LLRTPFAPHREYIEIQLGAGETLANIRLGLRARKLLCTKRNLEKYVRRNLKYLSLKPEQYENSPTACGPYVALMRKKFQEGKSGETIYFELKAETSFQGSESSVHFYVKKFRRQAGIKAQVGQPSKCAPCHDAILAMLNEGRHPSDIQNILRETYRITVTLYTLKRYIARNWKQHLDSGSAAAA
jgi:hypothetical protein